MQSHTEQSNTITTPPQTSKATDAPLVMSSVCVGGQLIHLSAAVRQSQNHSVGGDWGLVCGGLGSVKAAEGVWVSSGQTMVKCVGDCIVEGVVHLVNPY